MSKPTCGPLYFDGLKNYAGNDPVAIRLFAAGFISGEAEKVYLGASPAAMFRPSPDFRDMVLALAEDIAIRYELVVKARKDEIWLCRDSTVYELVAGLDWIGKDTPIYHAQRAWLCGVPTSEIDLSFHERKGYGERCEPAVTR